jgi:decaprenylphospho-beta-D-ribofuranose 2-oxidase
MVQPSPELLHGWGRTSRSLAHVISPASVDEVSAAVRSAGSRGVLVRGLGRSYGDAAQNAGGTVLDLSRLADMGSVAADGEIDCGTGVSIDSLIRHALPQGWFVPVTPGTRQVSLGGAVAADVHGKNHHRDGSIGQHVTRLELVDGRGEIGSTRPGDPAYDAVLGGLGLGAAVTSVRLKLRPVSSSWMRVDTRRTRDLDETMATLAEVDGHDRYSVAWLDCLSNGTASGRGVVTSGEHAQSHDLPASAGDPLAFDPQTRLGAPPWAPPHLLGRRRVAAFNELYVRRAPRLRVDELTPLGAFFHPLDGVRNWNRLYGRDGFVQYQFAAADPLLIRTALDLVRAAAAPVFLAVLKRFGPASGAPLSFPTPGWTLTMDLPADPEVAELLDRLDREVAAAGGRVYLAKDGRLDPVHLATMYPQLQRWRQLRDRLDPEHVFCSDLARRLHL